MHVLSERGMNVWQVWRRYEMKHKPAFILDFRLPQNFIDVNLTPDKREVAMMHESSILDALRNYMDLVSLCMYSCMYELLFSLYVNNFFLFFYHQIYAPSRYSLHKNEIHVQRTLTLTSSARAEPPILQDEGPLANLEKPTVEMAVGSNPALPLMPIQTSAPSQPHRCDPETNTAPQRQVSSTAAKWCFSPERALQRFKNSHQDFQNTRGKTFERANYSINM